MGRNFETDEQESFDDFCRRRLCLIKSSLAESPTKKGANVQSAHAQGPRRPDLAQLELEGHPWPRRPI